MVQYLWKPVPLHFHMASIKLASDRGQRELNDKTAKIDKEWNKTSVS